MDNCNTIFNFESGEKLELHEIERSIIKKYRKHLWAPFIKAIQEFKLVESGDKIAICISGGKDSMLLAKLFQELKKHGKFDFEVEFLAMNPGFNNMNLELLKANCEYLNIPVKVYDSDIFEVVGKIANEYPCYMCAKMRRGFLYSKAKELGCNKIALGHHFNDVIETIMLNVLYAGSYSSMMPRLKASNYPDMELIRPMYFIEEEKIVKYSKNTGLPFMNCGCVVAANKTSSKRSEIKKMISEYKKIFPNVDKSIFKSSYNVNINTVIGYKSDNEYYSFLSKFEEEL